MTERSTRGWKYTVKKYKKKIAVLINAVINTNSGLKLSYPAGFPN